MPDVIKDNTVTGKIAYVTNRHPHGIVIDGAPETGFVGQSYTLKGANSHPANLGMEDGQMVPQRFLPGTYGLTEVPADYWHAFIKAFAGWAPLASGAISAGSTAPGAAAAAMERKDEKTGLEGVDPKGDKKIGIEPASKDSGPPAAG